MFYISYCNQQQTDKAKPRLLSDPVMESLVILEHQKLCVVTLQNFDHLNG